MEASRWDGRTLGTVSLVLAACGALSFIVADAVGFLDPRTEGLFTLASLAGWVLVVWAVISGAAVGVQLVRAAAAARRVALREVLLLSATAALVTWVVFTHPLLGSGSGTA